MGVGRIGSGEGLNGGDTQTLVAVKEAGSGDASACLCIYRDGAVVIDDDIAVGSDGETATCACRRGEMASNSRRTMVDRMSWLMAWVLLWPDTDAPRCCVDVCIGTGWKKD